MVEQILMVNSSWESVKSIPMTVDEAHVKSMEKMKHAQIKWSQERIHK